MMRKRDVNELAYALYNKRSVMPVGRYVELVNDIQDRIVPTNYVNMFREITLRGSPYESHKFRA